MTPPVPDYRLTIDGQGFTPGDVTSALRPRLISLTLTEARGEEADQLDLQLDDSDGRLALPRLDAEITLALGFVGEALTPKGSFKVDERSHAGAPDVITLRARSADFTAALKVRQDRSWRDSTVGAVLRQVAGDHGLSPAIDGDLAARPVPLLDQSGRSDMDLLRGLGRTHDAAATIKAGRLIFSPIGKGATPSGAALPDFTIVRRDGDQHTYREAKREGGHSGALATWHDASTGDRHQVSADSGGSGPRRRLRRVHATQAGAQAAADAEARRIARGEASFAINLAVARFELGPEQAGRVQGFKPEADAQAWLIKSATHSVGDAGATTALELEVRGAGKASES